MNQATEIDEGLSYIAPTPESPWGTYLAQVDRVTPYLGPLARWVDILKRPKQALIVNVPIEMDDGRFERILMAHQERGLYP